ncbi:MAG: NAD(P)-binding domain-containing protein [Candidatus Acidiferrales bacterium]
MIIDGGNFCYYGDLRRASRLKPKGIRYVDVRTCGWDWGRERGYRVMIGGDEAVFETHWYSFLSAGAGIEEAPRTPGR